MGDVPGTSNTNGQQIGEDAENALGGAGFAVVPRLTCPHLNQVMNIPNDLDVASPCSVCDDTSENWICLTCYDSNCSRYVRGHSLTHFESTKHAFAISCSDFSAWCYECSDYVHNDVLLPAKEALHRSKFGNDNDNTAEN
ncbi:zn-finger in ubiquitin-hydrolases [Ditylenchus destructor]|nr:zn-finger in ubiquitin-hydrolases [Ditylenchus destructor]